MYYTPKMSIYRSQKPVPAELWLVGRSTTLGTLDLVHNETIIPGGQTCNFCKGDLWLKNRVTSRAINVLLGLETSF